MERMKRSIRIAVVLLLGFSFALSLGTRALAAARPPAAPQTQDELRDRLERWKKLPEPERRRLQENLRRYQALPEDKREELLRRQQGFEDLRRQILAEMASAERDRFEGLPREEQQREMTRRIRERRAQEERRFLQSLPQEKREELQGIDGPERHRRIMRFRREAQRRRDDAFVRAMERSGRITEGEGGIYRNARPAEQDRIARELRVKEYEQRDRELLDRLVRAGKIDARQSERILRTRGFERRLQIDRLRMREFLEAPPAFFFGLSDAERQRLEKSPPHRFFERLQSFVPKEERRGGPQGWGWGPSRNRPWTPEPRRERGRAGAGRRSEPPDDL